MTWDMKASFALSVAYANNASAHDNVALYRMHAGAQSLRRDTCRIRCKLLYLFALAAILCPSQAAAEAMPAGSRRQLASLRSELFSRDLVLSSAAWMRWQRISPS